MIDDARIAASPKALIEALEARIATLEHQVAKLERFRAFAPHEEARLRCELMQELGQLKRRIELSEQPSGRIAG